LEFGKFGNLEFGFWDLGTWNFFGVWKFGNLEF
jgi:hypothetical protein